jgi:hypothetical protein
MPPEQEDQMPQVQLVLDNVDRTVIQKIRTINGERPLVTMEVVLASSPNAVEAGPFVFSVILIDYDASQIHGTIGYDDDLLNTVFPAGSYTPTNSKGLFA